MLAPPVGIVNARAHPASAGAKDKTFAIRQCIDQHQVFTRVRLQKIAIGLIDPDRIGPATVSLRPIADYNSYPNVLRDGER